MHVIIGRKYQPKLTTGLLIVLDEDRALFACRTIELPFLGNQKRISCIPEGVYDCERIVSSTKGECFLVKNVPNRSAILIHKGNYAAGFKVDTEGCILVGLSLADINGDGYQDVTDSSKAMAALRAILPEKFQLIIR